MPHHSTDSLGVLGELVVVLLLLLLHPPLHFLPLHPFLAGPEGRAPSRHLVHQAAQAPPVGTHAVLLVVDHLRSCAGGRDGRVSDVLASSTVATLRYGAC